MNEPIYAKLVEHIRSELVERVHFGIIIHINKHGVLQKIGDDNNYKFYHRSCMKPLQISALIDLSADKKYNLSEEELAVCTASHTGDKIHQEKIKSILAKAGFTEDDLLCRAHEPLSKKELEFLILNGLKPQKIHNNCSGKHSAMLLICKEKGFSKENYKDLNHPLSEFIVENVCKLCGVNRNDVIISKDGCGLPVIATTLEELGRGFLNLFTNTKYQKITNAFLNNPLLIGGENRLDTQIIQNTKNIVAKVGAEGLCVIVNIEKEETVIIKIADSNMEARSIVAFDILKQLKWTEENNSVHKNKNNIIKEREIKTLDNELIGVKNVCYTLSPDI